MAAKLIHHGGHIIYVIYIKIFYGVRSSPLILVDLIYDLLRISRLKANC